MDRSVIWAGRLRLCESTSHGIEHGTRDRVRLSPGSVSMSTMLTTKRSSQGENGSHSAQRRPLACRASASGAAIRGPTGSTAHGGSPSGSRTSLRTASHQSEACAPGSSSAPS